MLHRRALLLLSSMIAILVSLFVARSSVAGRPARTPLLTATATLMGGGLPQNFMPLVIRIPTPTPTSTPIPTATATNPPALPTATASVPSATLPAVTPVCAGVANTNASNNPIAITNVNKVGETVSIQNVSADTIDLSGWWICSMLGHQLHAVLSGTIAPGQSIIIPSQAGAPIWNNTSTDPAALYRRNGVQIGYRTQ